MEEWQILLLFALSWMFICTMYITINNKKKDNVELSKTDKIVYGFSIILFIVAMAMNFLFFMGGVEDYGYLNTVKTGHGLKIFLIIIVGYIISIYISETLYKKRV